VRNVKGSRNEPEDYAEDRFIERVEGDRVRLHYGGKNGGLMRGITVEDARWLGSRLAGLSDRQIADAFRAANYTPEEVQMLSSAVRQRIDELMSIARTGATFGCRAGRTITAAGASRVTRSTA
jgi:hypothetical protein